MRSTSILFLLAIATSLVHSHSALTTPVLGRAKGVETNPRSDNGCDGPDSSPTARDSWAPGSTVKLVWKGNGHNNANPNAPDSSVSIGVSPFPSTSTSFVSTPVGAKYNYNQLSVNYVLPTNLVAGKNYVIRWEWSGWVSCHDFVATSRSDGSKSIKIGFVTIFSILVLFFL
eukprot:TRINITY_DN7823_c0_g1_i1.p1 TRINITY_DN7823_c0_g1~~TRINITY_DN7823_c0_g1_i1.p1  ORF type:complete len:192 (-),score=43.71 TRINITY_DN7823_c0_g1_i1:61-576(-)